MKTKWIETAPLMRIILDGYFDGNKHLAAQVMGCTTAFINSLLRGARSIPPPMAKKICAKFKYLDIEVIISTYLADCETHYRAGAK